MPDFVQTAPVDTTTRGLWRGMTAKVATKHDFAWMLLVRLPRWLILHPLATAGLLAAAWLWTRGFPALVALALALIPHAAWTERHGFFGVLAAAVRRRDYRRILPTLSNYWAIRRGWATGTTKIGFRQPGRGGAVPWLRHWEITAPGLAAQATPGRFGWTADDVASRSKTLAAGIKGCRAVIVTEGSTPGIARLDFAFADPLEGTIPITALPAPVRGRLSCGITERGDPAMIHNYLSTLIVGLPGSGKSNLLWTLIASAKASGEPFELWVLDPAGGVELWELSRAGPPLVPQYAAEVPDMRALIQKLHDAMFARMRLMAGKERMHTPTEAQPRIYFIVDELIRVWNNVGRVTTKVGKQGVTVDYTKLLVEILSMCRKTAITPLVVTQIPFGHSIGDQVRTLFPQKVLFRSNDHMMTGAVFGAASEAMGTYATKIPIGMPGVGYLLSDTDPRPVRFRTPKVEDATAALLAKGYLPDNVPTVGDAGIGWRNNEHVLYRWDNPARVPVCRYVGISVAGLRRADEHLSNEEKAELREPGVQMTIVRSFNVENCADRLADGMTVEQCAKAVEADLIRELEPPLNVAHNPGRRRRAKAAVGS